MGLTALDTGVVIGVLDGAHEFHTAALTEVRARRAAGDTFALSAIVRAELLVGAYAAGPDAVATIEEFLHALPAVTIPVDDDVAALAAELRATSLRDRRRRAWRLPDALVVASAVVAGASTILTTDRRWPALDAPLDVVLVP